MGWVSIAFLYSTFSLSLLLLVFTWFLSLLAHVLVLSVIGRNNKLLLFQLLIVFADRKNTALVFDF